MHHNLHLMVLVFFRFDRMYSPGLCFVIVTPSEQEQKINAEKKKFILHMYPVEIPIPLLQQSLSKSRNSFYKDMPSSFYLYRQVKIMKVNERRTLKNDITCLLPLQSAFQSLFQYGVE